MKSIILSITAYLLLTGCAGPRSEVMCISSTTGTWVSCRKTCTPGQVITVKKNKEIICKD